MEVCITTIQDFCSSIDETTPEKILVQASTEELKSEGCQLRVGVQLWQILHGATVDIVTATEFSMLVQLIKDNKVYHLDFCKYGMTLAEEIPPEPLELPN